MNMEKLLYDTYGYTEFRPGQKQVIEQVLTGRDVLALLPTGMGKSLCYQLPGKVLSGAIVIVSPLLSLMQDQVAQLKKMGEKSVVAINSFMKTEDREKVWNTLGNYKFIFVAPEMLVQPYVLGKLEALDISLLVADEAHCISQWGFDFRPDYLRIAEVLPKLGNPQTLALTATATNKVTDEIKHYLKLSDPFVYSHPMDRGNISYDIRKFENDNEKQEALMTLVAEYGGPGIIYAGTRRKSQELAERILALGIRAAFYHGGMEQQDRIFVQQQFANKELEWVCATNAFGMGVHIPDIRHVIHFQLPSSIEGYVQEVGRAGRDSLPSLATLLYAAGDEQLVESLIMDDLPEPHEIELVYDRGEEAKQLIEQGMIRETAYRIVSYWCERLPIEGTLNQIDQLRKEKQRQAASVRGLVHSNGCIRHYISISFDPETPDIPPNCCSFHGIDRSQFQSGKSEMKASPRGAWKERLEALLPI
ncbi:RecQ family ATP-dependent DNA helicase [Planococcus plakortidis]|uniref:RecQ family ATP-dependent DNA helicase n=1 Tax=Planococcus plakortidis TaxID=1038856 RepID=UPI0038591DE9